MRFGKFDLSGKFSFVDAHDDEICITKLPDGSFSISEDYAEGFKIKYFVSDITWIDNGGLSYLHLRGMKYCRCAGFCLDHFKDPRIRSKIMLTADPLPRNVDLTISEANCRSSSSAINRN